MATTIEDALTVLRFAQQTMMKRYTELEQLGLNNFLDLPEKGQALMVMVDEAGELLSPSGVKTEEGKAEDELKGEASMILGSIARLGRAAGVHLVVATQRPDATIITGETKANLGVRLNCGRTDSNASQMILGNGEGSRVKANPRGRLYLRIYGTGNHGQGFFAQPTWIDEYLANKGLNPDGSPINQPKSRLANLTDFSTLEQGDLDTREGVDNTTAIERIAREEAEREGRDFDPDEMDTLMAQLAQENGVEDDEEDGFTEVDDEDNPPVTPPANALDRPELTNGAGNADRFHRPEEDWDTDLESLIQENFE